MNPSFIVIGAAKCGTTSLCDLLSGHPDVYMTTPKEPHHYSRLVTFDRQRDWYTSLFDDAKAHQKCGEGSTSYTHPNRIEYVVPRLASELPDCRLIYMVRHPVARLESDWKMRRYENRSPETINEAAEKEASLISFGLYWKHMGRYRQYFSDEQILLVFLEDMAADPVRELTRVLEHIGVDAGYRPGDPDRPRNASQDFRTDDPIAAIIRAMPGLEKLKSLVPPAALDKARELFTKEFRPVVDWDPQILEAVRGHFHDDSARLLAHCGKSSDFWDLSSS